MVRFFHFMRRMSPWLVLAAAFFACNAYAYFGNDVGLDWP